MKTIYVVTEGVYSEYSIIGVFDDKSLAEKMASFSCNDGRVEEYTLNPFAPELSEGLSHFTVWMNRDGSLKYEAHAATPLQEANPSLYIYRTGEMCFSCFARDKEHAVKMANDRRLIEIAEGRWPAKEPKKTGIF